MKTQGRGYRICPECGEAYDCGEIHRCEGPAPEPPKPPRRDPHLEACRRLGMYVQPGYQLRK